MIGRARKGQRESKTAKGELRPEPGREREQITDYNGNSLLKTEGIAMSFHLDKTPLSHKQDSFAPSVF